MSDSGEFCSVASAHHIQVEITDNCHVGCCAVQQWLKAHSLLAAATAKTVCMQSIPCVPYKFAAVVAAPDAVLMLLSTPFSPVTSPSSPAVPHTHTRTHAHARTNIHAQTQ